MQDVSKKTLVVPKIYFYKINYLHANIGYPQIPQIETCTMSDKITRGQSCSRTSNAPVELHLSWFAGMTTDRTGMEGLYLEINLQTQNYIRFISVRQTTKLLKEYSLVSTLQRVQKR